MAGQLGWSWNDLKDVTWKELNWAWEAHTENRLDDLTLVRYELQKIFAAGFAGHGVSVELPSLRDLSPLGPEREENG